MSPILSFFNINNLREIDISYNQIKEIPISIINLRRLNKFYCGGNPIENLNPIVRRFLYMIQNRGGNIHNVYSDSQNVHTSSIQKCIKESLIKILSFSL